jgi:hypothetical protein
MVDEKLLEKYNFTKNGKADMEEAEEHLGVYSKTGYPNPAFKKKIVFEGINAYIEEAYFWIIDHLRHDWSFTTFDKITDVFAASAQSAFFGVSEQRLAIQQDKAAQYLRGISDMVKALFQIVRELRIIDERLHYYNDTFQKSRVGEQTARGSEITLKGIWVDQVEGGVKNAASVYGLAQTVGFTILPDLFFRVEVDDSGMDQLIDKPEDYEAASRTIPVKLDEKINRMTEFNEKVREVVKRKLTQYYTWKHRTYKELFTRRKFTIKYLRQHYDTINLYMGWIKPYLRNIKKLQLDEKKIDSSELIAAFEGAMIEIEVLAIQKDTKAFKKYFPCVLVHFLYRTRPALTYIQEGYQRGPAHTGKYEMTLRAYVWSEDQIHNYKQMKDEENLQLLSSINESIKAAMDALGEELKRYLLEGGEEFEEKERKKQARKPKFASLEPFTSVFGGFKEMFSSLVTLPTLGGKRKEPSPIAISEEKSAVSRFLRTALYQSSKYFKKAHGFIQW